MCSGLQHPRSSRGVPANQLQSGTRSSHPLTHVCGLSRKPAQERTPQRDSPAKAIRLLLPQIRSMGR